MNRTERIHNSQLHTTAWNIQFCYPTGTTTTFHSIAYKKKRKKWKSYPKRSKILAQPTKCARAQLDGPINAKIITNRIRKTTITVVIGSDKQQWRNSQTMIYQLDEINENGDNILFRLGFAFIFQVLCTAYGLIMSNSVLSTYKYTHNLNTKNAKRFIECIDGKSWSG